MKQNKIKTKGLERITLSEVRDPTFSGQTFFDVVGGKFESLDSLYPTSGYLAAFISSNLPIGDPPIYLVWKGLPSFHLAQKNTPIAYGRSREQAEQMAYQLALNFARELQQRKEYTGFPLIDKTDRKKG
jgi:hypothetical protein